MEEQAKELRAFMNEDIKKKSSHNTRIIAITSGKGGVGKTKRKPNVSKVYPICIQNVSKMYP